MEPAPPTLEPPPAESPAPKTSLGGRLVNILAAPGEVFDEIKAAPVAVANWLAPLLVYAVAGVISVCVMFAQPAIQQVIHEQQVKAMDKLVQQGKMTQAQEDQALQVMQKFMGPTMMAIFGSVGIVIYGLVSLFGWALVLWLMAQWFFKVRPGYLKLVEVTGLASVVVILGMVVSTLLCVVLGRLNAGPSLALLVKDFDLSNRLHLLLGAVNAIYLWHAAVLAVGLAKLTGGSLTKAFAVVFGFWVLIELLLIAAGMGQWAL